jgi:hypothetical protein
VRVIGKTIMNPKKSPTRPQGKSCAPSVKLAHSPEKHRNAPDATPSARITLASGNPRIFRAALSTAPKLWAPDKKSYPQSQRRAPSELMTRQSGHVFTAIRLFAWQFDLHAALAIIARFKPSPASRRHPGRYFTSQTRLQYWHSNNSVSMTVVFREMGSCT